jgi:hypothetical protein
VAEAEKEWSLPAPVGIDLGMGELLLLDWCLCAASRILPNLEMEYLITSWHDIRLDVWRCMVKLEEAKATSVNLPLTDTETKALLAICPTTFRWGTGPDDGYTLKKKLAQMMLPQKGDV